MAKVLCYGAANQLLLAIWVGGKAQHISCDGVQDNVRISRPAHAECVDVTLLGKVDWCV